MIAIDLRRRTGTTESDDSPSLPPSDIECRLRASGESVETRIFAGMPTVIPGMLVALVVGIPPVLAVLGWLLLEPELIPGMFWGLAPLVVLTVEMTITSGVHLVRDVVTPRVRLVSTLRPPCLALRDGVLRLEASSSNDGSDAIDLTQPFRLHVTRAPEVESENGERGPLVKVNFQIQQAVGEAEHELAFAAAAARDGAASLPEYQVSDAPIVDGKALAQSLWPALRAHAHTHRGDGHIVAALEDWTMESGPRFSESNGRLRALSG